MPPDAVRIGYGDVYQGTPLRFAPNIQVARDGRLGDRLVFDDKKNFAPRFGWAFTPNRSGLTAPAPASSTCRTPAPAVRHGAQPVGPPARQHAAADPRPTLKTPFRGEPVPERLRRGAAAGVHHQRLRAGQHAEPQNAVHVAVLFNVQRELGASTALEVGYLGSHSYRLERMFDWNETIPGARRIGAEPEAVSGIHQGPGDRERRRGEVQLPRGQADAAAARRIVDPGRLHVLQVDGQRQRHPDAERRHAFPQDSFCLDCEWGLSVFDVRHRFVASILYELPFGRGKPFLEDGVGAAILGGWQLSTIINDLERIPAHRVRRHRSVEHRRRPGSPERRTGQDPDLPGDERTTARWFNTNAYVLNTVGTWGKAGRNTFYGPGITSVDASIIRNFRLTRSKSLQFRLEAFNALNNPVWQDPNTTLTSPLYGSITTTRKPMRELQLGLKFVF